jgi:hypothetical protein
VPGIAIPRRNVILSEAKDLQFALKGHGFSRAIQNPLTQAASAAEGILGVSNLGRLPNRYQQIRHHHRQIGDTKLTQVNPKNQLYYGDNYEVLQRYVKDESVDLIYLDPPFNSRSWEWFF